MYMIYDDHEISNEDVYIYVYMCIYVYMYICIYIYIYVHIYIYISWDISEIHHLPSGINVYSIKYNIHNIQYSYDISVYIYIHIYT